METTPRRDASASGDDARVCLGAVAGAYGVRGEARLKAFTEDPTALGDYGPLETEDGARRFTVTVSRRASGSVRDAVIARLSGVDSREAVEALRGARLYAPREALPPPDDVDEFYHADLIGLEVVNRAGASLGRVASVQNYGAGDFLEVKSPDLRHPALMPFTKETAPEIDFAAGHIIADPPLGVFDEADDDADDAPAPKRPKEARS